MKNIVFIIGARPNFMKAFPVYEALKNDFNLTLIHTGQHFDAKMSDIFFTQLKFPYPDIHLTLESKSKSGDFDDKLYVNNEEYLQDKDVVISELINYSADLGQLGEIRDKLKTEFEKLQPDLVIVFGDITSTLAAALSAKMLNIDIAHVESGLRSGDMKMPEEVNRILTDHITKYYFVTEQSGVDNLNKIGIQENVFLVGNTMIDTQKKYLQMALDTKYYERLNIKSGEYILITLHRPSNVDNLDKLREIFDDLEELSKNQTLVYPIHPRTKNNLVKLGYLDKIIANKNIILDEPLGYLEFTCLIANCKYIITDSGGLQEESSALDIQCFTLRENTERPSTLIENNGTNQLINKISEIPVVHNEITNEDLCKESNNIINSGKSAKNIKDILNCLLNNKLNNIIITIDVEALNCRAADNHFDKLIFGKFDNQEYGVNKFIELGYKYGIKMLFFVNYINYYLDKDKFKKLIKMIKFSGHQIGIHLHPEDGLFPSANFIGKKPELKFIDDVNSDILIKIINEVNNACDINPNSYRGGGFEINKIFFEKLSKHGIIYFYNYYLRMVQLKKQMQPDLIENDCNIPYFKWYNNTSEITTTLNTLNNNIFSFENINELDMINNNSDMLYNKFGYSNIVIVLHSWYFLQRCEITGKYNSINYNKYDLLDTILKDISIKYSFLYANNNTIFIKYNNTNNIQILEDTYNYKYSIKNIRCLDISLFNYITDIFKSDINNIKYGIFLLNHYNIYLYDKNNNKICLIEYNFTKIKYNISYYTSMISKSLNDIKSVFNM